MDGERVDAAGEFGCKRGVDQAMTLDPALSAEGIRYDIDSVVSLAAGAVSGMAFVVVRFVFHAQAFGGESVAQLFGNDILRSHDLRSQ